MCILHKFLRIKRGKHWKPLGYSYASIDAQLRDWDVLPGATGLLRPAKAETAKCILVWRTCSGGPAGRHDTSCSRVCSMVQLFTLLPEFSSNDQIYLHH